MIDNAILLKERKLDSNFLESLEVIPNSILDNDLELIKYDNYMSIDSQKLTLKDWYLDWLCLSPGERVNKLVLFDAETSHLNGFAVSLSFIEYDLENKTISREFYKEINPQVKIDPETIKIHGITDEMVANAPTFEMIFEEIKSYIEENELFVAHNAIYDISVLIREYERMLKIPPKLFYLDTMVRWKTEVNAKNSLGKLKNPKLSEAASFFGITYDESTLHNALYDTQVLTNTFHNALLSYES